MSDFEESGVEFSEDFQSPKNGEGIDLMDVSSGSTSSNKVTQPVIQKQEKFQLTTFEDTNCETENVNENIVVQAIPLSNPQTSSEDDSDKDEIILSTYWRNEQFGAAYYNTSTSELHLLNQIIDSKPEHAILKNLFRQVQPVIVVCDGRAQTSFQNCLKNLITGTVEESNTGSETDRSASLKSKLHFLPNKEYNFESCKRRIYLLTLPNEAPDSSESDHENFLHSIINFHHHQTVHALGALLKYLDSNWGRLNIDNNAAPSFLQLNTICLKNILTMDDESYKALQVFKTLSHPSNFKKGTAQSNKEGLSLFALYNKCHSKIGSKFLRVMLQHPTRDETVLKRRLDTIEFINKPGNEEIVKSICSSLRFIKNVNGIMTRIKGLRATPYEWKSLFNTLYNGVLICEYCEKYQGNSSLIDSLGSRNNYDLFQVAHHMNRVIDFDVSKTQGKFTVKLGIDPELDRKKQMMLGLHGLMSNTAKHELEKLPTFIEECTMVYLPNMGYLLGIKAWAENLSSEEKELPNLKFMFQNHDCIHYKSKGCEELDHRIGDTHSEILAHEMRIMMRLTKFILQHLHSLATVIAMCAELDCIICIARVSKNNDYTRPTVTTKKIIKIQKGRHPLQELCINSFVPNCTKSTEDDNLITILTGANASGKSVYLKQVALIVYMAHIGSFVPAESATIGLLNSIYTRVHSVEDISTRMSGFLIDLRQVSVAIQESTSASLIIIDEFGKGTSEIDGFALLAAIINHFIYHGAKSPHIFVSTHFHNVNKFLIESSFVKLKIMEHIMHEGELVFLHRLIDGTADGSCAFQVAEIVGIDKTIIARAKQTYEVIKANNNIEPNDEFKKYKNIIKNMVSILRNNNVTKASIKTLKNQ